MLYLILATLIVLSLYNSVWFYDCGLGCLAIRDGGQRDINRCTCNTCFCAPIQTYGTHAGHAANSISLFLSSYTDRFYDLFSSESGTCVQRHAELPIGECSSFYSESIEEFILVPDSEVPVAEKLIPKKKTTFCASTSTTNTSSVTQTACSIQSSNVAQAASSATQYGCDLVGQFTELTLTLSRTARDELKNLIRLRSKLSSDTSTSTKSKEIIPEVEETIDAKKNCSKYVEQGILCVRECPSANNKQTQNPEVLEAIDAKKNCSRCVEQGIICVRECPSANNKQTQNPEVLEAIDAKKNCSRCVEQGILCVRECPSANNKQTQNPEVLEAIDAKKNCSRCVEQGILCVRECPSANNKQTQNPEVLEAIDAKKNCSRCVEQGILCVRECPSANNKQTQNPGVQEATDAKKNCSKCVEQGKACGSGCKIAEKKRRQLNIQ